MAKYSVIELFRDSSSPPSPDFLCRSVERKTSETPSNLVSVEKEESVSAIIVRIINRIPRPLVVLVWQMPGEPTFVFQQLLAEVIKEAIAISFRVVRGAERTDASVVADNTRDVDFREDGEHGAEKGAVDAGAVESYLPEQGGVDLMGLRGEDLLALYLVSEEVNAGAIDFVIGSLNIRDLGYFLSV